MAAVCRSCPGLYLTRSGEPARLNASFASSELLRVLGVRLVSGRWFTPEEDRPGSTPSVVLSHRFWADRLGTVLWLGVAFLACYLPARRAAKRSYWMVRWETTVLLIFGALALLLAAVGLYGSRTHGGAALRIAE